MNKPDKIISTSDPFDVVEGTYLTTIVMVRMIQNNCLKTNLKGVDHLTDEDVNNISNYVKDNKNIIEKKYESMDEYSPNFNY